LLAISEEIVATLALFVSNNGDVVYKKEACYSDIASKQQLVS